MLAPERATTPTNKPRVAATIFPVYDIVRNVAGDAVDVTLILEPGAEPHSFEPTPSVIRDVSEAAAVYAIGHDLDSWTAQGLAAAGTPEVTLDAGIELLPAVDHGINITGDVEDVEEVGIYDPHYWLSVPNAIRMAENAANDLAARFPDVAIAVRYNLADYRARLTALDTEIRTKLSALPPERRAIVTFHPAWYYFAQEYDFTIAGTFESSPGREPTPRGLQALSETVAASDVRALYVEPLFSDAAVRAFAADRGLSIASIDDIGGTGGRDSYESLMRHDAQIIAENQ